MLIARKRPVKKVSFKGYTNPFTGFQYPEAPKKWPFGRVPPRTYKATPKRNVPLSKTK